MKRLYLILGCMLLVAACLPTLPAAPTPPFHDPVLIPRSQPAIPVTSQLATSPHRVLLIGSLFAEDIDVFLEGLAQAANPTVQLEVASIILPAT